MRINSYAKINVALFVGEKRLDGYHDVHSTLQMISLMDVIDIELTGVDGEIDICVTDAESNPVSGVPSDSSNLAVRAAKAFLELSGEQAGIAIKLVKNIPNQAGLGGGSSNAAAVLTALNGLFGYRYTKEDLVPAAAKLGADVPFFLYGGICDVEGIGEIVKPRPPEQESWMVIVKPPVGVSTATAYAALDAKRTAANWKRGKFWDGDMNSFQPVIFELYPEIAAASRALLDAGCEDTLLCGSGSAIRGYLSDSEENSEAAAELIAAKVRASDVGAVYIAKTVTP